MSTRKNKGPNLPTPAKSGLQQNMQVDLSTAYNVLCSKCHNFAFVPAVTFKKLSAIMSPTGKEGVVPIETYMCSHCGYIPPEFMPVPIRVPDPRDSVEENSEPTQEAEESVSEGGIIMSTKL